MATKKKPQVGDVEILPIDEAATLDIQNTNLHTQRGGGLLENSLRRRGANRSVASAGKGVEIPVLTAGNYTYEKAVVAGFEKVMNVYTDGSTLVNVVRLDIAPGTAEAIALGIEDNEIGKVSYAPDITLVAQLAAQDSGILSETLKQDKVLAGMLEDMGAFGEPPKDAEAQIGGGEALAKWNVKEGDLFGLGIHKLFCGDSTKRVDIERLVNDNQYCVLTDPPYNIGFEYNGMDDKMTAQGYADFCQAWFGVVSDAVCLIFSPGPKNVRLYPEPRDLGYWLKRNASAGASEFNLR